MDFISRGAPNSGLRNEAGYCTMWFSISQRYNVASLAAAGDLAIGDRSGTILRSWIDLIWIKVYQALLELRQHRTFSTSIYLTARRFGLISTLAKWL